MHTQCTQILHAHTSVHSDTRTHTHTHTHTPTHTHTTHTHTQTHTIHIDPACSHNSTHEYTSVTCEYCLVHIGRFVNNVFLFWRDLEGRSPEAFCWKLFGSYSGAVYIWFVSLLNALKRLIGFLFQWLGSEGCVASIWDLFAQQWSVSIQSQQRFQLQAAWMD